MRGKPVDKNAPRKPLTAFMLFMKQRRSDSDHLASLSFGERNRLLGAEWSEMSQADKQVYFTQAAKEREKYNVLIAEYKSSDAYKSWLASNEGHQKKTKGKRVAPKQHDPTSDKSDFKVSIFTSEFLQYNRLREVILRQLKKQAVQLEEETALLSKHVDNLVHAETRIKNQLQSGSEQLAAYEQLQKRLRRELVAALSEVTIPYVTGSDYTSTCSEHITETSVESFVARLNTFKAEQSNAEILSNAQEAMESAVSKKVLKLLTF